MAALRLSSVSRTATNLAPTVAVKANGVPLAPFINLAATTPADSHAHGHGPTARSDVAPAWASSSRSKVSGSLLSKTYLNGKFRPSKSSDHFSSPESHERITTLTFEWSMLSLSSPSYRLCSYSAHLSSSLFGC